MTSPIEHIRAYREWAGNQQLLGDPSDPEDYELWLTDQARISALKEIEALTDEYLAERHDPFIEQLHRLAKGALEFGLSE